MTFRDQLQITLGDNYTLERELGGGGMSRVFVAEEAPLGRRVVVKVLPAETEGVMSVQRFKREIQLAARLHHPHIVPVLTAGEVDGVAYYTMPFVSDETLRSRLALGPMSFAETVRILREVTSALAYAHKHGIVHRDIKPENVLLSGGVASVTDFGVAKAVDAAANEKEASANTAGLTSYGVALGTPAYMSPEQASADPNVDHRADIYALGVLAYEMIAGTPPFSGRSPQQLLAAHVTEAPEPVSVRRPDVPPALEMLVMRCLEKNPDDRPQTADDVVHMLDALTTPTGGSTAFVAGGVAWRRPSVLVPAAVLLVLLAFSGFLYGRSRGVWSRGAGPGRRIAVLPFTNLSGDKTNEYFSDGITQEINDALGKVPGLRVSAQGSAATVQSKGLDLPQIAKTLGVDVVLTGSVQRSGDRVRIAAQLVNASDGFSLWTNKYDREIKDVFAVQDEIAKAIVSELRVTLVGGPQAKLVAVATVSPEAHALYLQGLYFWNRRTSQTIRQSISFFEQAIAKDSSYAAAWVGVALGTVVLPDYADVSQEDAVRQSGIAARRALALDSTQASAYAAIGLGEARLWQNAPAEAAFRKAIALDSNYATAHQWYASLLAREGRFALALTEMKRAYEADPLSLIINSNLARLHSAARDITSAQTVIRRTIGLDSNFAVAHEIAGGILLQQGKNDEAIAEMRRCLALFGARPSYVVAFLGHALAVSGHRAEANELLNELLARAQHEAVSQGGLALLHLGLGDREHALESLRLAVQRYDSILLVDSRDIRYDPLRADPKGAELFARTEAVH